MIDINDIFNSQRFSNRFKQLEYVLDNSTVNGLILEFGVYVGNSINIIADRVPEEIVYGFDSFTGLPETWLFSQTKVHETGHFSLDGTWRHKKNFGDDIVNGLPKVRDNVELVVGYFNDVLDDWIKNHPEDIRLLHIDSDLYSSAKYVLETLNAQIVKGTIIVFDELCDWRMLSNPDTQRHSDYVNWEDGEWKALNEWLSEFNREVEAVSSAGRNQAALIVTK